MGDPTAIVDGRPRVVMVAHYSPKHWQKVDAQAYGLQNGDDLVSYSKLFSSRPSTELTLLRTRRGGWAPFAISLSGLTDIDEFGLATLATSRQLNVRHVIDGLALIEI